MADRLAQTFTVIAIDLRGYGKSTKPPSDDEHATYSKRAMAQDCVSVMSQLGFEEFYICAHDRGARVAHRLCIDYPSKVRKAIFLDIAPTLAMYSKTNFAFAKGYYHWFFLIQDVPYPETLILGAPEEFMKYQMGARQWQGTSAFTEECYASYVAMMKDGAGVHAMCEDYRAAASIDLEHHKADIEAKRHIQCPLLVIWGSHGMIEQAFDAVKEWQDVSSSTVEGKSFDCGHYIPEEQPDALLKDILAFFPT